ncbi:MAG: hypothetical protein KJ938_07265 [Actinobacteria bacterium]|nr:hypothetical protein [Actinomycetota bacterium]
MADAREPDEGAGSPEPSTPTGGDLVDRWLAHRAEDGTDAPRPRTYGVPRTGVRRPDAEQPVDQPADQPVDQAVDQAVAEDPPVEVADEDPPAEVRGSPVTHDEAQPGAAAVDAPATAPSGRHPAAPATPTGLTDFEPVVLASVRRQEEQPAPPSRFGRRRRGERPTHGPDDPALAEDPAPETPDTEAADTDAADTEAAEVAAPEAQAAAPDEASADAPVAAVQDEVTTTPSAAAEVFAAFNAPTAPPIDPRAEAASATPRTPTTPKDQKAPRAPRPARAPRTPGARPGAGLAKYAAGARELLDRSVRGTPEERTARPDAAATAPAFESTPTPTPEPDPPAGSVEPAAPAGLSTSAYDALRAEREAAAPPRPAVLPPDIDFRPRTLARRVTSLLLLLGLAMTLLAAWRAYDSRVQTDIGFAAILALFTGIVWAVRAGSVPTRMSLHGGLLEVRTQAGRFLFELTSAHTHLEMVGTPGRPGWKVLIHRRGMNPFEITRAMVDPHEFVDAVRYYRPRL